MKSIKSYFGTFEKCVQFQLELRKRALELYNKWFHNRIVRNINKNSMNSLNNMEFLSRLTKMLNIPKSFTISKTEKEAIIKEADKACNGLYELLGSGEVKLDPVDWHIDFKTGIRWAPGIFCKKYNQEDIKSKSDVKIPRELSRSHHMLKAGLAYRMTGKEEYAELCINQMKGWIDDNPLMYSINWGCTMDVAIRAVNWIWVLGLVSGSKTLDIASIEKIKSSLYQHGWFIFRNPEKGNLYNGNHYLSDLAGQIHLGLLFNNMKEPAEWLESGKAEFFREIRLQILPTGMSFERSSNYNRLVLELILITLLVLKRNHHEIPSDIWYRLETMFAFIMHTLKPDGNSPIIGDKDNGRLLPLGVETTNDFRYLLSLGALLFNRSDFKCHGDGFNIYCSVLAEEGATERWNSIPDISTDLESIAFKDSGLYIMRKKDDYLLFTATGKGKYPEIGPASHTHSDLFSFELFTSGKSFLIDPGTYVYTADAEMRMLYRSTKMHNTVTVDGQSQNHIRKEVLWDFKRDAIPQVLKWVSDSSCDTIVANHNGFTRLPDPVMHERSVTFDKVNEKWIINDLISGKGKHEVEWFFHFAAGIDFTITGDTVKTNCDDKNIAIVFEQKQGLVLRKEKSFISGSYGMREEGNVLVACIKDVVPVEMTVEIKKMP